MPNRIFQKQGHRFGQFFHRQIQIYHFHDHNEVHQLSQFSSLLHLLSSQAQPHIKYIITNFYPEWHSLKSYFSFLQSVCGYSCSRKHLLISCMQRQQGCIPPFRLVIGYDIIQLLSIHHYIPLILPMIIHKLLQAFSKISRFHNRIRIDEHHQLSQSKDLLDDFLNKEKVSYDNLFNQTLKKRTQQYYQRVHTRNDPRNISSPEQYDGYKYYTKANWMNGKEYTTIYRKKTNEDKEVLVLDIMSLPQLKKFQKTITLNSISIDPTHQLIAFGCDLRNNQQTTWMIKNIKTGKLLEWKEDQIDMLVFDNSQGFFTTKLKNMIPKIVNYYHLPTAKSWVVYQQQQPSFYVNISVSKDNRIMIINSTSNNTSKIYGIWLNQFNQRIQNSKFNLNTNLVMLASKSQYKTQIYHRNNQFIIWRLCEDGHTLHTKSTIQNSSQELVHKTQPYQTITSIDIFEKHIVLYIKCITKPMLRIIGQNRKIDNVLLPYQIGTVEAGANKNYYTSKFVFHLNTPFIYNEEYQYDFIQKRVKQLDKFQLVGGFPFKAHNYHIKTVEVPSQTGDTIPLTIISPSSNPSPQKLLLHVYGCYGMSLDVNFTNHYLAALENNWTIAYAHVRGGTQKGKQWHIQGKMKDLNRSSKDLIQCVGYLLKEQYTHPSILFLHSHSAGAITAWNAVRIYPHLFKGLILKHPFLDVLGSLLQENQPLSSTDYQQFGNPIKDIQNYSKIQSFSPYETIQINKEYPFLYIVGGQNDYRCPTDQIAKFTKRFRARVQTVKNTRIKPVAQGGVIIKIDQGTNHYGSADLMDQTYSNCQILAFMDYIVEEASLDCTFK